jgi:hypothetical protein
VTGRKWLAGLSAVVFGCSTVSEPVVPSAARLESGTYRYVTTTTSGEPLLEGVLTIAFADDTIPDENTDQGGACCHWTITGTWDSRWIPGADTSQEIGPQVGSGELRGAIQHGEEQEGRLLLDLNPYFADNNTGFDVERVGDRLVGVWGWTTLTGLRSSGHFTAVRQ